MTKMRSNYCGQLNKDHVDKQIQVCGWVATRRDHGGVIFIDLRDHTGIVQVVCEPENKDGFMIGEKLRPEHVIQVTGTVRLRPNNTANINLPTGEIEVLVTEIEHLNIAQTPAFYPNDEDVTEEIKLENRVIHLRSDEMQKNLRLRHAMASAIRKALEADNFVEVETPMLTLSTPEGARDFLVPARNQMGSFYALPQSPQLFKQMLISGGIDRYYQFARCFRDEDLRAGRQPEFTQIDIEMAFVMEDDVMAVGENVIKTAIKESDLGELPDVPRMKYQEAMEKYGCDTPHLGIDMQLVDIKPIVKNCNFKVFAEPANNPDAKVVALNVPGGAKLSRKQIDDLTSFAQKLGAGGLAYLKVNETNQGVAGVSSPIAKFLGDDIINSILTTCNVSKDDLIFFGAGLTHVVNAYMSQVRVQVAKVLNLVKPGLFPVWITDFPLFELDYDTKKLISIHHPFTAPVKEDQEKLIRGEDLTSINSYSYDLVLNGVELGGGSIRIHESQVQLAALKALEIDEEEAREKFGFLLDTLDLGTPPHGGIAFGFDRLVAIASESQSIRDVIAFPKTQKGICLFTGAPQPVSHTQLIELGLQKIKTN